MSALTEYQLVNDKCLEDKCIKIQMETLRENLEFFCEDLSEFQTALQDEVSDLEDSRNFQRNEILRSTAFLKQIIQNREDELLEKYDKAFSDYEGTLKMNFEICAQITEEVNSLKSKTDGDIAAEDTVEENEANKLQVEYDILQGRFDSISEKIGAPVFRPFKEDVALTSDIRIGKIEYAKTVEADVPTVFSCRNRSDQSGCFLTSILWENKLVVVSDKSNQNIKFYTEDGKYLSEVRFADSSPYGVCSINDTTFVATLPKFKQLYFIIFQENVAKPESYTNTKFSYSAICKGLQPDSLIVTVASNNPGESQVDIVGYRGQIYRSFKNNAAGRPLFMFPRYVTANQGVIIVSDWRLDCVMFVQEATGTVLKEYRGTTDEPLINPYDITLDSAGNVYILNGKDGAVHVLDIHCNLVDVIKNTRELLNPRLLSYDKTTQRLAVAHGAGSVSILRHVILNFTLPYSTVPNSTVPNTAVQNSALPNSAVTNATILHSAVPNSAVPNSAVPNSNLAKFCLPNSAKLNSTLPNSGLPNSAVQNSTLPIVDPDSVVPISTVHNSTLPNSSVSNSALPNSAASDSAVPNSAVPNSAVPNSTLPDSALPNSEEPESTLPNSTEPESALPNSTKAESALPNSTEPESALPNSAEPDSALPDSAEPDSALPKISVHKDVPQTLQSDAGMMLTPATDGN